MLVEAITDNTTKMLVYSHKGPVAAWPALEVRVLGLLFNPAFGVLLFYLFWVMIVHFSLSAETRDTVV